MFATLREGQIIPEGKGELDLPGGGIAQRRAVCAFFACGQFRFLFVGFIYSRPERAHIISTAGHTR
jgi:hypothetical protein